MKISTQAAKNPTLAAVTTAVLIAIGGGKRQNSGVATIVSPNQKFPGIAKSVELGGFALRVLGYKLVGEVKTSTSLDFRGVNRYTSSKATYSNGTKSFQVAAYVGCGVNFEVREVKAA